MLISPTTVITQGSLYWCDPEPKDTVGGEHKGDHIWVVVSLPRYHRGNCVVALPLSRHIEKTRGHLIKVLASEITMEDGNSSIDRVALTDQVRALDKTRFRKKAGYVSSRAVSGILLGIDFLFGNAREPNPSTVKI